MPQRELPTVTVRQRLLHMKRYLPHEDRMIYEFAEALGERLTGKRISPERLCSEIKGVFSSYAEHRSMEALPQEDQRRILYFATEELLDQVHARLTGQPRVRLSAAEEGIVRGRLENILSAVVRDNSYMEEIRDLRYGLWPVRQQPTVQQHL